MENMLNAQQTKTLNELTKLQTCNVAAEKLIIAAHTFGWSVETMSEFIVSLANHQLKKRPKGWAEL